MSKKALYLLGIFITLILGCIIYYFVCCKKCAEYKANQEAKVEEVTKVSLPETTFYPFQIQDNSSGLQFKDDDNFKFKTSEFKILDSVGVSLNNQLERLTGYLNDNPTKNVNITGLYRSNEDNASVYPNLGIARATSVKNYLVSYGISPKSLQTNGQLTDVIIPDSLNILHGPLKFDVKMRAQGELADGKILKDSLNAHPLVLYFKTGANSLTLDETQRQKVVDLLNYIETYDAKLLATGHTDNTGNRENNIKLALERAEFVKRNLISNGVNSSYIMTDSKGPDFPIANNETEQGRAENRRVEVNIN